MIQTHVYFTTLIAAGIALFTALLAAGDTVQKETPTDRIVIQRPTTSSPLLLRGTIIDYTGQTIKIRFRTGSNIKKYPAKWVVKVTTPHVISYLHGMKYAAQKKPTAAIAAFEKALLQEDRKWVRREILASLVRAALQSGDYKKATSQFLMLTASDSETFHFHLIPLQWRPSPPKNITVLDGFTWMQSSSTTSRLTGASRLLMDEKYRHIAKAEMKQLAINGDRRISTLAKMQLWRLELQQPKKLTKFRLQQWQKEIEAANSHYRAGGWYLLGTAHAIKRNYEPSATALLWLPLVYDDDAFLAAHSCFAAADSLLQIGKKREAVTLLQEVVKRFSHTSAAQEATVALKKLQHH